MCTLWILHTSLFHFDFDVDRSFIFKKKHETNNAARYIYAYVFFFSLHIVKVYECKIIFADGQNDRWKEMTREGKKNTRTIIFQAVLLNHHTQIHESDKTVRLTIDVIIIKSNAINSVWLRQILSCFFFSAYLRTWLEWINFSSFSLSYENIICLCHFQLNKIYYNFCSCFRIWILKN